MSTTQYCNVKHSNDFVNYIYSVLTGTIDALTIYPDERSSILIAVYIAVPVTAAIAIVVIIIIVSVLLIHRRTQAKKYGS